ncbi:glycoside hydrolase family 15 protein [Actinomadura monticuli]|uniref:Glycoside hydrolase family 15 protein n=1 Tax=Actinomadura monticuli TaxID=3097367 RepID=A0ABV4Q2F4_9ACTN
MLTGLTSLAGGMVAAATTALPERSDEGRNFDYRYAWIRDQCFAGHAVAAHGGPPRLLRDAAEFAAARILADGDRLRPAYTVTGGQVPPQHDSGLPGYPGAATSPSCSPTCSPAAERSGDRPPDRSRARWRARGPAL